MLDSNTDIYYKKKVPKSSPKYELIKQKINFKVVQQGEKKMVYTKLVEYRNLYFIEVEKLDILGNIFQRKKLTNY